MRRRLALAAAVLALGCTALPARGPETRIVFFTDVHARPGGDVPNRLLQAARAINEADPDLVIGGGDLVAGAFMQDEASAAPGWDAYLAFQDTIDAPVHTALGNHDLAGGADDPRAFFRRRLGVDATYGSTDVAGLHLVLLDSVSVVDGVHYEGRVDAEQLAWLERDLAALPADQPIVLALHLPLRTGHFEGPAPADRAVVNADEVLARFRGRRLVLVLQGHLHVHEHIRDGDTTFLTGGAVSGGWWKGSFEGTPPGFYVVELRGGRVDARYQPY